ncbi:MAG: YbfB/YjiJ family MFS transporter [Burkholderiaceae bacterium]
MNTPIPSSHSPEPPPWRIVVIGVVALAVAMGIGRFAFTPLLPLMLRDGSLAVASGAEWAAANYVGYLLGALTATRYSLNPVRGLHLALMGVTVTTLAVAFVGGESAALVGAMLRAAAGVFSAWVLVCVSSWGLSELARRHVSHLGALIYAGVGLGITLAGLIAWLGGLQRATWLWAEFGVLAAAGSWFVWKWSGQAGPERSPPVAAAPHRPKGGRWWGQVGLVFCYGSFGFGYIVPATFLPAMAREQVSDPLVFGLAWPLFGLSAALSVVAAARWLRSWPRQRVWALAQAAMALGTALPLTTRSLWALALSAVFVGGTFMVATMAGLQLARERSPADPTRLLARMTGAFAVGQIIGPLAVRAIGADTWWGWNALMWANALATVLLALTASWLWFHPRGADAPAAARSPSD